MAGSTFKILVLPPLIAIALYLMASYVLAPLYRQRQRYAQYLPVAMQTELSDDSWLSRLRRRALSVVPPFNAGHHRRESGMSDEELEPFENPEAGGALWNAYRPRRPSDAVDDAVDGEHRLSRELEAGFADDSEEEEDDR